MATEYEELQLRVTLVDEATPKLEPLLAKIKQIGGGEHGEAFKKFKEETKSFAESFKPLGREVSDVAEKFLPFVRGVGGAAAGFAALGLAVKLTADRLKDFSSEMSTLGTFSRTIGLSAAQIKSMREDLDKAGVAGANADRAISAMAATMSDVAKDASAFRQHMLQLVGPEGERAMTAHLDRLRAAAKAQNPAQFWEEYKAVLADIEKTEQQRGYSSVRIAEDRRKALAAANLEMLADFDRAFRTVTAEQEQLEKNRVAVAQQLQEKFSALSTNLSEISTTFGSILGNTKAIVDAIDLMVSGTEKLLHALEAVERFWGSHKEQQPGLLEMLSPGAALGGALRRRMLQRRGGTTEQPTAPQTPAEHGGGSIFLPGRAPWDNPLFGGGAAAQPQRFASGNFASGGGYTPNYGSGPHFWDDWPASRNIEDRRSEQQATRDDTKAVEENTTQLRRLNDLLQMPQMFASLGDDIDVGGGIGRKGGITAGGGPLGYGGYGGRSGLAARIQGGLGPGGGAPTSARSQANEQPTAPPNQPTAAPSANAQQGLPDAAISPAAGYDFSGISPAAGSGVPAGFRGRNDVGGSGPASIRYNNPGAQYPSPRAAQLFGMQGYGIIGGGHQIARFSDPVHGAAANMDLFEQGYVGKTIGAAGAKWTGNYGFGVPGYDPNTVVTREMMRDPKFAIPFFKAIAQREAGRKSPLTDEQWAAAHQLYLAGGNTSARSAANEQPTAAPTAASGDARLTSVGNYRAGSDARRAVLMQAAAEASKSLPPGWRVEAFSGERLGRGQGPHSYGAATDFRLIDPQGHSVPDYQDPKSFATYEKFAQDSHRALQRINPQLAAQHRWGGYFSGALGPGGTYGAMDLMHQDFAGGDARMAAGQWATGLHRDWRRRWGVNDASAGLNASRASIDQATTQRVEGSGTINVNVKAPTNTSVNAAGGGLFNKVQVNRQIQMEPAATSAGRGAAPS